MHVNFKKIRIQNFLSFGPDPVDIEFKPGIHLITGINKDKSDRKNGVGKSAVLEALHFALFGSTTRDIQKDNIANNIYEKSHCVVTLTYDVIDNNICHEYKLIRSLNPSKCILYKNGIEITRDSIANTTKDIQQIIGVNPDTIQNSILMSMNATIPFMALKKTDKRKYIESIFNLEIFSKMLLQARQQYNDTKNEWSKEVSVTREMEQTFNALVNQQEAAKKEREDKRIKYLMRKETNLQELKELEQANITIESEISEKDQTDLSIIEKSIEDITSKQTKINKIIGKLEYTVSHKQQQLNSIGKNKKCPTCGQIIQNADHESIHKETLLEEIKTAEENIIKCNQSLDALNQRLSVLNDKRKQIKDRIQTIILKKKDQENNKSRIAQLKKWLQELEEDLASLDKEDHSLTKLIEAKKADLENQQQKIKKLNSQLNLIDAAKYVLSEEGIKSYIVKKMLAICNSRIAYYLKQLEANCICIFNEFFEEEIVNERGKPCSYFNFSSAERKNIDMACLFAFQDVKRMQGDFTYNLSFYDEFFDSCLDEKGIDLVIQILKERVKKHNECIMLISHRKESIKAVTGDIIMLEKRNGITTRVPFKY